MSNKDFKIKVCGLTDSSQINELIKLKIDYLGFIFYKKSPRYVLHHLSLEEISNYNHPNKVGVFVNETIQKIIEISEKAKLNLIQLHGDEGQDFINELKSKINKDIKLIKVIRVGNELNNFSDLNHIDYVLFDTDSKAFGGTGKTFDWQLLNHIAISKPYFLSGGISLENLENISILEKQPFALDINSKFETQPGSKDLKKIEAFVNKLKSKRK